MRMNKGIVWNGPSRQFTFTPPLISDKPCMALSRDYYPQKALVGPSQCTYHHYEAHKYHMRQVTLLLLFIFHSLQIWERLFSLDLIGYIFLIKIAPFVKYFIGSRIFLTDPDSNLFNGFEWLFKSLIFKKFLYSNKDNTNVIQVLTSI